MPTGRSARRASRTPPRVVLLLESSRASGRALLRGVARYAQLRGPWSFYWEPAGLNRAWPVLKKAGVDGIILRDVGKLEEVVASGIPAVVVGHSRTEVPGLVNVVTDSEAIGRMAAEHLLECGLRHFGYCGLARSGIERTPWSEQRAQSFAGRLAESGFGVEIFEPAEERKDRNSVPAPPLVRELEGIARWLKRLPKPVGVMACNDDRGQQVIEACRLAGLAVPDEVAVIGVDNDELICGFSNPPLSSVALNFEKAGYESADALQRMFSGRRPVSRKILVHPTHVVMRHATNILAVDDPLVAGALRVIREQCERPLLVAEVARAVAVSRRVLEKRFRAVLARSILSEIRRARVNRIAQLLAGTTQSIAEIAGQLRFDGPQHIARYFRAEKGLTPREFRRLAQPS
jgi:LacI family transcriptional regulator